MSLFHSLRDTAAKRAAYRRTLSELSTMSGAMRRDLGIAEGDLRRIASEAVYGR